MRLTVIWMALVLAALATAQQKDVADGEPLSNGAQWGQAKDASTSNTGLVASTSARKNSALGEASPSVKEWGASLFELSDLIVRDSAVTPGKKTKRLDTSQPAATLGSLFDRRATVPALLATTLLGVAGYALLRRRF